MSEEHDVQMEVLCAFDHLDRHPDDPGASRGVLCAPPEVVVACLSAGLLVKQGTWSLPTLTARGKTHLRRWRTCWDCGQECVEQRHTCPAQRPATPYRHLAQAGE